MFKRFLLSLLFIATLLQATPPSEATVTRLYIATFDRAPDSAGLTYWLNESGLDLEGIATSFFDQDETQERYPSGFSHADFIEEIYKNLFTRGADSEGFEYWHGELEGAKVGRSVFILAVINGALGDDADVLANKLTVGLAFVRADREDVEEAKEIMLLITADATTVNPALCKHTLSGCYTAPIVEEEEVVEEEETEEEEEETTTSTSGGSTSGGSSGGSSSGGSTTTPTDTTAPTLTITDNARDPVSVTLVDRLWVANSVTFTFTFSESVTGFTVDDITVANGTKGTFSGSGDTYTLEVTPPTHSTTDITVDVASGVAVDGVNNGNLVATQATQEVNTVKAFITTWKTDNYGASEDTEVKIGTNSSGLYTYDYSVDWGDGESDDGVAGDITHTYNTNATYTIKITGVFPHFSMTFTFGASDTDNSKLLSIKQWGTQPWKSMSSSFAMCSNLNGEILDNPNLSNVTSMSFMFNEASLFNQPVNSWDVSNVTDMNGMFGAFGSNFGTMAFNQPLDNWDVSKVTDMSYMFCNAIVFNQNISNWNTSNVTDMSGMFYNATAFTQPLNTNNGKWDVSNVTTMQSMFENATSFSKPLDDWDVSSVTNMQGMFAGATTFNQDISGWNVESVTHMGRDSSNSYRGMFQDATGFTNQDLWGWNVANVTDHTDFMTDAGGGNTEPNWYGAEQ